MKLENKIFIETITNEDIPWQLLCGPYERASDFPQWIKSLEDENELVRESMENKIALNFEHQETLYPVTPFVMLMLRKNLNETKNHLVIESILKLYSIIYELIDIFKELYKYEKRIPLFSDLINKENLLPEITISEEVSDNEELLLIEYYDNASVELFLSVYYYSWLVLAYSMKYDFPKLNENIKEKLKIFNNESTNLFLNDILIKD